MSNRGSKKCYLGLALVAVWLLTAGRGIHAAEKKTLEGIVSDTMCGATHNMQGVSPADCTNKCVEMGSKYALVVSNQVYELDGKAEDLKKLAGEKVKLTGTVDGKKIQVESVSKP